VISQSPSGAPINEDRKRMSAPINEDCKRMRQIKSVPRAATSPVWAALARARRCGGTSSSSEAPPKASACSAMVVLVPEAVAAAGNCHLLRGRLGIGSASVRDGEQKGSPFGGGFGTLGQGLLAVRRGEKKNLAAG